jgi:hypothetical protein
MGLEDFSDKPWNNTIDWCTFQIGQCRIHVDIKRTKEFYKVQPKITENCTCNYCKYFEEVVLNQSNRLFELLRKMEVDLTRQPNVNPNGVFYIGDTKRDKLGYTGNYFVYGEIGKTSNKTAQKNDENVVCEVTYNNTEFGDNIQVTIKQITKDQLFFEFYMEADKTIEI